jgi:hypothetical protein
VGAEAKAGAAAGQPALWLIAGPDRVGETSHARRHLRAAAGTERFAKPDEVFCILPDVEAALRRIAARVTAGGHAVPEADARCRFPRARANFSAYAAACDPWRVLDTQMAEPRLVAAGPTPAIADAALLAGLPEALRAQLPA